MDATGQTLGRLARDIAVSLQGKDKPSYTPHTMTGDFVVVVNASRVRTTGRKTTQKYYYRHSGYVGNLKSTRLREMLETHPERVIELAVKGMLPATTWDGRCSAASRFTPGRHTPTTPRSAKPINATGLSVAG